MRVPLTKCLTTFGIVCFIIFISWKVSAQGKNAKNIIDTIKPCFELTEFIATSAFVDDYQTAHNALISSLQERGILLSETNDTLLYRENLHHFTDKNNVLEIGIIQQEKGKSFFDTWYTTKKTLGWKFETENNRDGSVVYLQVKTNNHSKVGALFNTGRNLFDVRISLPFPVPESYDELDAASQSFIDQKFEELYNILLSIAHHYVAPHEFVFFPTHDQPLTREQRLYGLIQFWTEVKYNFAFFDQVPDLNWDYTLTEFLPIIEKEQSNEEYYRNMMKMCALLKDGHTNIYPPTQVQALSDTPPLQLINIQNKAMVANVTEDLGSEIPLGTEILSVDDISTPQYLADSVFPYISASTDYILWDWGIRDLLKGKKGSSVKVKIRQPDGNEHQLVITRSLSGSGGKWVRKSENRNFFEFKHLPNNIAYVALNSFGNSAIAQEFQAHLDSVNNCQALIIDLRANGGGNSSNGYEIIKYLTDQPFLTSKWKTREHRAAYKAWGYAENNNYRANSKTEGNTPDEWNRLVTDYFEGNKWYEAPPDTILPNDKKIDLPLVVLIGHNSASAAEDFLIALESIERGTFIGQRTFGSTGQPLFIKLPGGGQARICTKRDTYPDGKEFVGYGIEPDVYVENSLESFLIGNDPVLEKALDVLMNN